MTTADPDPTSSIGKSDAPGGRGGRRLMIPADHCPDAQNVVNGNGNASVELRVERSGLGDGRVYEVTIEATDSSGDTSVETFEAHVPHDQRDPSCPAVDSGDFDPFTCN